MMCEVLLQGLEEAVSLEYQLRECQLGEQPRGKAGEAGEGSGAA